MPSSEKPPQSRLGRRGGAAGAPSSNGGPGPQPSLGAALGARTRVVRQLGSLLIRSPRQAPQRLRDYRTLRRSPLFDRDYYLRNNPGVAREGISPIVHYLGYGADAGIDPSPSFSTDRYVESQPELRTGMTNPLAHLQRRLGDGSENKQGTRRGGGALAPSLSTSVIVSCDGPIEALEVALRSALAQSRPAIELIVCDEQEDGAVAALLQAKFAEPLKKGLLVRRTPDPVLGLSARNAGLESARGEAIAYLRPGVEWDHRFLAEMTSALAEAEAACTAQCVERSGSRVPASEHEAFGRLLGGQDPELSGFVHLKRLHQQLGGFNEQLEEAAERELIIRYVRCYPPVTRREELVRRGELGEARPAEGEGTASLQRLLAHERVHEGLVPLRIAYVLWDFPALSQSFVIAEIRELVERGYDVRVYFRETPEEQAELGFEVPVHQVSSQLELSKLLGEHERTLVHAHFAHPAASGLAWPAARAAGLPFTLTAHAIDIFHRENRERNQIAEMAADELCVRVFTVGAFHRNFLIESGVAAEKISIVRPAANLEPAPPEQLEARLERPRRVVACIARLVEKKGVGDLIRAAALLGDEAEVQIYGYGPLEQEYRELSEQLGAGNVAFAGRLEHPRAVAKALEAADVFALPCIRDSHQDMDGLPTVIGEAMAAGVPVITTDIAAIGEVVEHRTSGIIVPQGEPQALADAIRELLGAEAAALRPLLDAAQERALQTWSAARTVEALLDCWERPPLEIALVTHSRGERGAAETTGEIIRRIYELTTSRFRLTIVDNASEPTYAARLRLAIAGRSNARLLLLGENRDWGPALNLAWRGARGENLIYVCSNEGFILQPGWERAYVEHLRANREVALAGHLISSPAFATGRDYTSQPWFRGFRNPAFAREHPDREFAHVQGGLFAARRSVFESSGGFSDVVTQEAPDVEFSHFLESLGWRLGSVAGTPSLTSKTRPELSAHLDESTVAAHPLSLESVQQADELSGGRAFCNVCGWSGQDFGDDPGAPLCPRCGATPFGRLVFRFIANSPLPFRGLSCAAELEDPSVLAQLGRMFNLAPLAPIANGDRPDRVDLVVADLAHLSPGSLAESVKTIDAVLGVDGLAIVSAADDSSGAIAAALAEAGFATKRVSIASRAVRFPPQGLLVAERSYEAAPTAPARS